MGDKKDFDEFLTILKEDKNQGEFIRLKDEYFEDQTKSETFKDANFEAFRTKWILGKYHEWANS